MTNVQSEEARKARADRTRRVWAGHSEAARETERQNLSKKFNRLMKDAPKNPKCEAGVYLSQNLRTFAVANIILDSLSAEERKLISKEIKNGVDCVSLAAALS
ncbi:hypothetical protein JF546_07890 [Nitratireductor aquimarinus]|uniref:hypothetical protein n=1 Tax=Nitratireductor aquimarinus TaxID=889300 RepID=UPI001A8F68C4|nr:hypothetical protein [Nitratireductor aquimarinus]MBN8242926.1 hypothetical protein [Nitratireductor aquimarinus]MBY6132026.1 hypothetical protein [Nitratireductor aquimarinus]MCA1301562.1 hypothetical protein [Nitratireductor aquimarinus]